jgi:hypothetical protein
MSILLSNARIVLAISLRRCHSGVTSEELVLGLGLVQVLVVVVVVVVLVLVLVVLVLEELKLAT